MDFHHQFIRPNPKTFDLPMRQYFSLPFGIISYITQNPLSPRQLGKLQETCKYFFAQNKIVIIYDPFGHGLYSSELYFILTSLTKLKFWVIGCLSNEYASNQFIIPENIYRFSLRDISTENQNFTLNEINLLLDDGKSIKDLRLIDVNIRDDNGGIVSIDRILAKVPNLDFLFYTCRNEIFSNETFEKLNALEFNYSFRKFEIGLYNISENADVTLLCDFVRKNATYGSIIFGFYFKSSLENFQKLLQTAFDKILEEWDDNKRKTYVEARIPNPDF